MTIDIRPATCNDATAIASIWNARVDVATSCFYNGMTMAAQQIRALLTAYEWYVLEESGAVVAFSFWTKNPLHPLFVSCGATSSDRYYRLFRQCGQNGLARGCQCGYSEVSNLDTDEVNWVKALGCAQITPMQFDEHGAPTRWRVECDYNAGIMAVNRILGDV